MLYDWFFLWLSDLIGLLYLQECESTASSDDEHIKANYADAKRRGIVNDSITDSSAENISTNHIQAVRKSATQSDDGTKPTNQNNLSNQYKTEKKPACRQTSNTRLSEHDSSVRKSELSSISSYNDNRPFGYSREEFDSSELFTDSTPDSYRKSSSRAKDAGLVGIGRVETETSMQALGKDSATAPSELSSHVVQRNDISSDGSREDVQSENVDWKTPQPAQPAGKNYCPFFLIFEYLCNLRGVV